MSDKTTITTDADDLEELRSQLKFETNRMLTRMYAYWGSRGVDAYDLRIEFARMVLDRTLEKASEDHHKRIAPQRTLARAVKACERLAAVQSPPQPQSPPGPSQSVPTPQVQP
jgi:hypothetical protein